MIRQTREAMVKAIGVKMQAKRPAFPMMAVVGGGQARWCQEGEWYFFVADSSSFE